MGGKVAEPDTDSAISPHMRGALLHLPCPTISFDGIAARKCFNKGASDGCNAGTQNFTRRLKELGTGAYLNEANYYEPGWQDSFWGANYPRLLSVKKAVDPDGVLTCHNCVGSEL